MTVPITITQSDNQISDTDLCNLLPCRAFEVWTSPSCLLHESLLSQSLLPVAHVCETCASSILVPMESSVRDGKEWESQEHPFTCCRAPGDKAHNPPIRVISGLRPWALASRKAAIVVKEVHLWQRRHRLFSIPPCSDMSKQYQALPEAIQRSPQSTPIILNTRQTNSPAHVRPTFQHLCSLHRRSQLFNALARFT